MKISDFIGETTAYDKKVRLEENRPKSWLKSVSAFANGVGGFLVFGISDNDELIGVENASRGAEKISEIINAKMDPVPTIHLQILKEGGMDFIVLQVFPGDETPYYYSSDRSDGEIDFVLQGKSSVIPLEVKAEENLRAKSLNTEDLSTIAAMNKIALNLRFMESLLEGE